MVGSLLKALELGTLWHPFIQNLVREFSGVGFNLEKCFIIILNMWHVFKLNRSLWSNYNMFSAISIMFTSLDNLEITSRGLASNYAKAHRLKTVE